jgi:plastocyanin
VWNSTTNTPGSTEVIGTVDALAPLTMTVPAGSTVTFTNPATNANAHGAASFWEHEFDAGVLMPGQSFTHTFNAKGEFFYNDPIFPKATGKIIVT